MRFKTYSDMGSIKIYTPDASFFFHNGIGDGKSIVTITKKHKKHTGDAFIGHFTVKTEVHISGYDCSETIKGFYILEPGRWFVYLDGPGIFTIEYMDDHITA